MSKMIYTNMKLMATPTEKEHVVNKGYVDNAISKKIKDSVVVVTATNIEATYDSVSKTLTQNTPTEFVIDEVTLQVGDRVLVAGQTDATQNGIYVVTTLGVTLGAAGVLTRADDFDSNSDLSLNLIVPVQRGMQNADTTWVMSNDVLPVIDVDQIKFAKMKAEEAISRFETSFVGDGVSKEFVLTHGLQTKGVVTSIKDAITNEECIFSVEATTENTVTIKSDIAIETDKRFDVIIMG